MKLKNFFKDLDESILDPIHKDLSPDIWTRNRRIKPEVKKHILDHIDEWLPIYTDKRPTQVFIAGSMAGFQYTRYSDIDINIVINLSDEKRKELGRLLPNGNLLPKTQHPVNYFLALKFQLEKSGALYDILKDKWIEEPKRQDVNIHYKAVLEISLSWMRKVDLDIHELERDVLEYKLYKDYLNQKDIEVDLDEIKTYLGVKESEIKADIDAIHITYHMIKKFRREPFEKPDFKSDFLTQVDEVDANYTINNLVYKTLERFKYLDKLHKYSGLDFEKALGLEN